MPQGCCRGGSPADMMLKLTWTGDADLDLSVEEPNGGICSFENPFTNAGGAYTHDGYGPKAANCFEEYICASALPGDYVVRVRAIDGEAVGHRATLTIRRLRRHSGRIDKDDEHSD